MCPRQNYLDPGDRITDPQEVEGVDAMGRGRAKAKQTKVARELKYFSPDTDLRALERERHGSRGAFPPAERGVDKDTDDDDYEYEDRWAAGGR